MDEERLGLSDDDEDDMDEELLALIILAVADGSGDN